MKKTKLIDFVNDKFTDKNTRHSYIEVYDKLFQPLRYKAENILEIGIRKGGSIKMLHDYFEKATITAIDNKDDFPITFLRNLDRVHLHFQDAYNIDFINSLDRKYDIINENAIVVVEDVKGVDSAKELIGLTTSNLDYEIIDLNHERPNAKGGHMDNILIVGR